MASFSKHNDGGSAISESSSMPRSEIYSSINNLTLISNYYFQWYMYILFQLFPLISQFLLYQIHDMKHFGTWDTFHIIMFVVSRILKMQYTSTTWIEYRLEYTVRCSVLRLKACSRPTCTKAHFRSRVKRMKLMKILKLL